MELNYKASNIAAAERKDGKHFFNVFSSLGNADVAVEDLQFIWHCGGGDDDSFDEAFKAGMPTLMATVMEGINVAGFLGFKIDTKALKAQMEQAMQSQQPALQNTGKDSKA